MTLRYGLDKLSGIVDINAFYASKCMPLSISIAEYDQEYSGRQNIFLVAALIYRDGSISSTQILCQ